MKIPALIDIVEGKLLNSPAISFITQIHTQLSKINDGDALFIINKNDIPKAIEKGAFALIYDFDTEIIDEEIAWIKVDDIYKSISNILRYRLVNKDIKLCYVDEVSYHMASVLKSKDISKKLIFLQDNIIKDFELLINHSDDIEMVFSKDETFLNSITPNIIKITKKQHTIKNLVAHSLFETSFSYKHKYYEKLKLPQIYINDFLQLSNFIDLDIKKVNNLNLFKPIFINKSNHIVQYGQTNRFILSNKIKEITKREIKYLKKYYSYANIVIEDVTTLGEDDILDIIKERSFNALYLIGVDIQIVAKILEQNHKIDKLF